MAEWQRARNVEQISFRTKAILDAAGHIFGEVPYEKVTMQLIADKAKFTRSNLYRYFKTREEIFLTLYRSDIEAWLAEFSQDFAGSPAMPVESFASKWTDVLLKQERLIKLSPLLSLSLEKNVSEDLYREFKTTLNSIVEGTIPILKRVLPHHSESHLMNFMLFHAALVAGLWPMCQYSDMQKSVLASPELSHFKMEFRKFYVKSISAYLGGIAG